VIARRDRAPYALWELYAASTRGRVHPFLQFTNLADVRYQEIPGVWMPGRAVVGGLEWVVLQGK
jgi:iron complex outermembrane receptor protein